MIIGVLFAACVGCSSVPPPTIVPAEQVQAPSKLDAQREMEYRQLRAALSKAQKAMERFDQLSTWGP